MYVSVTGLKGKGIIGLMRFWLLAIPSFKAVQRANGILFWEVKTIKGWHHTLTVWETPKHMMAYRKSPSHLKAMKAFPSIAVGKVHGYGASKVPTWEEALREYEEHGRVV